MNVGVAPLSRSQLAIRMGAMGALALLVATLLAASRVASGPARGAQTFTVAASGFAFTPQTLTITVGDTVTWENGDPVDHTVTTNPGAPVAFDLPLPMDGSVSRTFTVAGTYDYYCIPHPQMTGTIIVQPALAATATPTPGNGGSVPDVAMPQPGAGPWLPPALGVALLVLAVLRLPIRRSR